MERYIKCILYGFYTNLWNNHILEMHKWALQRPIKQKLVDKNKGRVLI